MKHLPQSLAVMTLCMSPLSQAMADTLDASTQTEATERIIVTGSRIEESIDEVPASITVITRQQISQQLKVSPELQNLLATMVPGMSASTGTSSNSAQTLRGRNPLVMIDGVPQSTPLRDGALAIRTLDPSAIERIEVIKGATSIYGNGAAGGIINYITKQAASDKKLAGDISLSSRFSTVKLDDSQGYRINAAINGELNNFSYVANASYEENGVQRDAEGDIIGLQYGLSDAITENYFTKLGYYFDDTKRIQLTYNYYKSQQETNLIDVPGSVNTGVKTYAVQSTPENRKKGEPQGPRGNKNIMLKYSDDELFANTALVFDAYSQTIENVFFYSPNLANPDAGLDGGQSMIKSDKQGLRLTLTTQIDWDHVEGTFIYGVDALQDDTSQPLLDGRMWVPEMEMENLASFLQTKWLINNNLILKAGLRNEEIDLRVDNYSTLKLCKTADQCSVPVNVLGDTLNYKATTYNLGIKYNALAEFSPFISYSQGADISDIGRLLRTATVTNIADIQTEASIIDNYEVGFSSTFEALRFEFSAFKSTSELGTTNKFDPITGVYMPVRAPQKIWGYEGLVNYQLLDNLNINATYSWVEGKDTKNDVYLGGKQISAPKATIYFDWQPMEQANISLTYLYVGDRKRFEQVDGEWVGDKGPINSYQIVNLSANYQVKEWLFFAGIENLLNKDYYPARSQVYTYTSSNLKGLGTTVNLGVNYSF